MLLLARQLAWYHSVPEGSKISRQQQLQEPELKLPECENEFLVLLFYEAGMYDCGAAGIIPLSWHTIACWLELLERDISLFDKETIRKMSEAYVSEYNAASDKNRARPFVEMAEVITEDEVAKNAKSLKESLLAVAKAQQGMQ